MIWNKDNVVGKKICVGIVYLDKEGNITDRVQNFGWIKYADDELVEYTLADTPQVFTVPAFYEHFEAADKELAYVLEDSGERVNDIDIVATFTVAPKEDN